MVKEMTDSILLETGLPTFLWPWITCHLVVYILNRTPKDSLEGKSPIEAFHQWLKEHRSPEFANVDTDPPKLINLKIPGCRAYPLDLRQEDSQKKKQKKGTTFLTRPKGLIGYLVGYKSST